MFNSILKCTFLVRGLHHNLHKTKLNKKKKIKTAKENEQKTQRKVFSSATECIFEGEKMAKNVKCYREPIGKHVFYAYT